MYTQTNHRLEGVWARLIHHRILRPEQLAQRKHHRRLPAQLVLRGDINVMRPQSGIKTITLFLLSMTILSLLCSAEAGEFRNSNSADVLRVEGIGYPPIKAQSIAQAHLMARRAAIINAYRNALTATAVQEHDDNVFYSGLSGFVKGLIVLKEEYLKDGGVRVVVSVPVKNITVSAKSVYEETGDAVSGPLSVTLDAWYKVIRELVTIEK